MQTEFWGFVRYGKTQHWIEYSNTAEELERVCVGVLRSDPTLTKIYRATMNPRSSKILREDFRKRYVTTVTRKKVMENGN